MNLKFLYTVCALFCFCERSYCAPVDNSNQKKPSSAQQLLDEIDRQIKHQRQEEIIKATRLIVKQGKDGIEVKKQTDMQFEQAPSYITYSRDQFLKDCNDQNFQTKGELNSLYKQYCQAITAKGGLCETALKQRYCNVESIKEDCRQEHCNLGVLFTGQYWKKSPHTEKDPPLNCTVSPICASNASSKEMKRRKKECLLLHCQRKPEDIKRDCALIVKNSILDCENISAEPPPFHSVKQCLTGAGLGIANIVEAIQYLAGLAFSVFSTGDDSDISEQELIAKANASGLDNYVETEYHRELKETDGDTAQAEKSISEGFFTQLYHNVQHALSQHQTAIACMNNAKKTRASCGLITEVVLLSGVTMLQPQGGAALATTKSLRTIKRTKTLSEGIQLVSKWFMRYRTFFSAGYGSGKISKTE